MKGKRDLALLAILVACGLRRQEAVELNVQQREHHWAIVDLIGKASHMRTNHSGAGLCEESGRRLAAFGQDLERKNVLGV